MAPGGWQHHPLSVGEGNRELGGAHGPLSHGSEGAEGHPQSRPSAGSEARKGVWAGEHLEIIAAVTMETKRGQGGAQEGQVEEEESRKEVAQRRPGGG